MHAPLSACVFPCQRLWFFLLAVDHRGACVGSNYLLRAPPRPLVILVWSRPCGRVDIVVCSCWLVLFPHVCVNVSILQLVVFDLTVPALPGRTAGRRLMPSTQAGRHPRSANDALSWRSAVFRFKQGGDLYHPLIAALITS